MSAPGGLDLEPAEDEFAAGYGAGRTQLVRARLAADLDTPVSAMLKLAGGRAHSFLLESVTGGEARGRYSIVGLEPDLIWRCHGERAEIWRGPAPGEAISEGAAPAFAPESLPALASLRALLAESAAEMPEGMPAASAGLFGYLGYDAVRLVERLPDANPDAIGLPDAVLMRPTLVAVLDGVRGEVTIVSPARPAPNLSAAEAHARAAARVAGAVRRLEGAPVAESRRIGAAGAMPEPISNFSDDAYRAAVERAREYVRAGDVFQVVPSQRWSVPFAPPPFALYRALRRANPSPFMFYVDLGQSAGERPGGTQIVGASPEILVRLMAGEVTIRPIAGTRPRGATPEADRALEAELLADDKELAEHLMLLDLGRNDVGRVAEIGSVRVTEAFAVERYSHVMHIVSNVTGRAALGVDALAALLAGLPAGTVSGAPKVRAMEIIDELEPVRRGVYGGGVGYFSAGGDMDMCIALRTGVIAGGTLHVQAGGGVVLGSDPEAERQETAHKARAVLTAAAEAHRAG